MSRQKTHARDKRDKTGDAGSLDRLIDRALAALAVENAYGRRSGMDDDDIVAIVAPRRGVSVRIAGAAPAVVAALLREGLADWQRTGATGTPRLCLSATGQARAARLSAAERGEDPFQAQHGGMSRRDIDVDGARRAVVVDDAESPLAWLARRRGAGGRPLIDPVSLHAGERLRGDLTFAQILPRVTSDWNALASAHDGGGGPQHFSDVVIAARQRVDRALAAVGAEFAGLLVDVCGFLKGLETIEAERGWPRRSGKVILTLALAALARHYGLSVEARGPARARRLTHWGAEDYRPRIDASEE